MNDLNFAGYGANNIIFRLDVLNLYLPFEWEYDIIFTNL